MAARGDGGLEVLDGGFVVEAVGRLFQSHTSLRHEWCELGGQRIGGVSASGGVSWFDGFIEAIGRIGHLPAEMQYGPASRRAGGGRVVACSFRRAVSSVG